MGIKVDNHTLVMQYQIELALDQKCWLQCLPPQTSINGNSTNGLYPPSPIPPALDNPLNIVLGVPLSVWMIKLILQLCIYCNNTYFNGIILTRIIFKLCLVVTILTYMKRTHHVQYQEIRGVWRRCFGGRDMYNSQCYCIPPYHDVLIVLILRIRRRGRGGGG